MVAGLSLADTRRLADDYRRELIRLRRSPVTVRIYMWGMRSLMEFAATAGIVNPDSIQRWQDDLFGRLNPRSAALAGVSVRRMLAWAAMNGECDAALARAVPPGKYDRFRLPRPLTPSDLARVEASLRWETGYQPNIHELRDKALFYYVKATAARVSEVLQVHRATYEREVVRQTQRSGGEKTLAPPPGVVKLIDEYLAARTDDLEWLWVGIWPSGKISRLQDDAVNRVWKRLARRAGVPRFTTYQLRHTAGAILAERGHDVVDIMVHLGARDVRSVQGYRQVAARSRMDQVRADLDVS